MSSPDPWKHRSAEMCCASCMWFVLKERTESAPGGVSVGRCRKRSPTMDGYPVVYVNDWCGQHKLDENKTRPLFVVAGTIDEGILADAPPATLGGMKAGDYKELR